MTIKDKLFRVHIILCLHKDKMIIKKNIHFVVSLHTYNINADNLMTVSAIRKSFFVLYTYNNNSLDKNENNSLDYTYVQWYYSRLSK